MRRKDLSKYASETGCTPHLILTPSSVLCVSKRADDMTSNANIHQKSIIDAFHHSQEQGLLQLLVENIDSRWSLALKYWRDYIALYMNELCHHAVNDAQSLQTISTPAQDI